MDTIGGHADGAEIRRLRQKAGYGRAEFAALAGIAASSLTNIENGTRSPKLDTLADIAKALDVPLLYVLKPGSRLHAAITSSSNGRGDAA